ncbi:hypothetical protein GOBAR_DD08523 [Gossypium barbadense]|nr:hypothetical protein GOBAR_DD08523 [Gossypium barbadense]
MSLPRSFIIKPRLESIDLYHEVFPLTRYGGYVHALLCVVDAHFVAVEIFLDVVTRDDGLVESTWLFDIGKGNVMLGEYSGSFKL